MKTIILSIAVTFMMGVNAFAANNDEVNQATRQAFNRDFVNATNIGWEQRTDYVKVTFTLNDQVLFAYYNNSGDLKAVVRNIVSDQLPLNLMTSLKRDYSGYWISDLFEIASDDQTSYYVTLENMDKTIVLKSAGTSLWNVYTKIKKETE
jgi:hypothetical protein